MSANEGLRRHERSGCGVAWSAMMAAVVGWTQEAVEEVRRLRSPEARRLHQTHWQVWTAAPDPVSSSPAGCGRQLRVLVTETNGLNPLDIAVTEAGIWCHGEAPLRVQDGEGYRRLVRRRLLHGAWMARRRHADACGGGGDGWMGDGWMGGGRLSGGREGGARVGESFREAALASGVPVPAWTLGGEACLWVRRRGCGFELHDGVVGRPLRGASPATAYWALDDHYRRLCVPGSRLGPLPALGLLRGPSGEPAPPVHRIGLVESVLRLVLQAVDQLMGRDDAPWGDHGTGPAAEAGRADQVSMARITELRLLGPGAASWSVRSREPLSGSRQPPDTPRVPGRSEAMSWAPPVAGRMTTACGRVVDVVFHEDALTIEENSVPVDAAELADGTTLSALAHLVASLAAPHLEHLQWQLAPQWQRLGRARVADLVPDGAAPVELARGKAGRPALVLRRTWFPVRGRIVGGWELATGRQAAHTVHGDVPVGALLAQVFDRSLAVRQARQLLEATAGARPADLC
mgnify:CR=1 FL=1